MGSLRRVDGEAGCRRSEQSRRKRHLPLSRPRPSPRHGSGSAWIVRKIPCADRRTPAGLRPWGRRRRARLRHGDRTADVHADPATGPNRRSPNRNRVLRLRRGGLRLHVRLIRRTTANSISQRITGVSCFPAVGLEQLESIRKPEQNLRASGATQKDKVPCRPPLKASQS